MRAHNIPSCYRKSKKILIKPPDWALLSTLIGSNYPCLELIFMVPKVFEPLKFDCITSAIATPNVYAQVIKHIPRSRIINVTKLCKALEKLVEFTMQQSIKFTKNKGLFI